MKPRQKTRDITNYGGRAAFLAAAQEVWKPAPLENLTAAVRAVEAWLRLRFSEWVRDPCDGHNPSPQNRKAIEQASRLRWKFKLWPFGWAALLSDSSPKGTAARIALEQWRSLHPIWPQDTWIMDYTLRSIAYHVRFRDPLVWYFCPGERLNPGFSPDLHIYRWSTDATVRKRRQQELVNDLRKQIRSYDARTRAKLRESSGNLEHHALLTARWFAGKSVQELSRASRSTESTISRNLKRFAVSISLTTPPPKRPTHFCGNFGDHKAKTRKNSDILEQARLAVTNTA